MVDGKRPHADINVPDLAEARQFYRVALAPLGREELADPHGGVSCGVEGLDNLGISGDSEDRHRAHVAFGAPTRRAVDAFNDAALKPGSRSLGPSATGGDR